MRIDLGRGSIDQAQYVFGWAPDDRAVATYGDRAFDQSGVCNHGFDPPGVVHRFALVRLLVDVLAGADELVGGDAEFPDDSAQGGGVGRRLEVENDLRLYALFLEELQCVAALGTTRIVIEGDRLGHAAPNDVWNECANLNL